MLSKLMDTLISLSSAERYLVGTSIGILINPKLAVFLAAAILTYFIYKIGKQLVD